MVSNSPTTTYPTFFRWFPVLLWMLLIFLFSSRQSQELPSFGLVDLLVKKAGHMVGYGVLMVLCYRAIGNWRKALAITILYACSDEFHQTFVPSRYGSVLDVGVDTAGAVLGFALYHWFQQKMWRV